MGYFKKGKWIDKLDDDELKLWREIVYSTPVEYENRGYPQPFGYWHRCPTCDKPLIYLGECRKPYGTEFLCLDCKTVWFESHATEDNHMKKCEEIFNRARLDQTTSKVFFILHGTISKMKKRCLRP